MYVIIRRFKATNTTEWFISGVIGTFEDKGDVKEYLHGRLKCDRKKIGNHFLSGDVYVPDIPDLDGEVEYTIQPVTAPHR